MSDKSYNFFCAPIPIPENASTENMPESFRECQTQLESMEDLSLEDPPGSF